MSRTSTQVQFSWRATLRTIIQTIVGFAPLAPVIYHAIYAHDPAQATGFSAAALAITGAITRVMAIPAVDDFITKFLPWLAPQSKGEAAEQG